MELPEPILDRVWRKTARGDQPGPTAVVADLPERSRHSARRWAGRSVLLLASASLFLVLAGFLFGPNLGFTDGQPLAANTNINSNLNPDLAMLFEDVGIPTGKDRTIYLSEICMSTNDGTRISTVVDALLRSDSVSGTSSLADSCAQSLAPAGKVTWSKGGVSSCAG